TEAGYAVESAATATEAIARCQERRFHAVTLDLLLPDMSGLEVLRSMRGSGPNRDVPVIVVSIMAREESVSGFSIQDVVGKPCTGAEVLAALVRAGVPPQGRGRVLVVDNDRGMLDLMSANLRELGYEPRCQEDPIVALADVETHPPQAIVLDLLMPRMTGFEFLLRLRKSEPGRHIPVLIWSAKDLTTEERLSLSRSAQAVLTKEVGGRAAMLAELRHHLGGQATLGGNDPSRITDANAAKVAKVD
ncbi:MAG TPA: response regulator, partial [Polyangia bacterium]